MTPSRQEESLSAFQSALKSYKDFLDHANISRAQLEIGRQFRALKKNEAAHEILLKLLTDLNFQFHDISIFLLETL